jgi:hypothetical protein
MIGEEMGPSDIQPRSDHDLLLALRGDVKHLQRSVDALIIAAGEDHKDHESRIRTLEKFRWYVVGAIVGSAGLSAALAAAVTHAFESRLIPGAP